MSTWMQFSHLLGLSVYVGATVLLGLLVSSVGRESQDPVDRRLRYAAVFRVYNPLAIAALGVVVMTGAWSLTPYKEALGAGYFAQVGAMLANKLGLAFLVIMFGVYIALGIGHRLVRSAQGALPVTDEALASQMRRLQGSVWTTMLLTAYTIWYAMGMHAPALPS